MADIITQDRRQGGRCERECEGGTDREAAPLFGTVPDAKLGRIGAAPAFRPYADAGPHRMGAVPALGIDDAGDRMEEGQVSGIADVRLADGGNLSPAGQGGNEALGLTAGRGRDPPFSVAVLS